jgi:hypothetical protein
VPLTFLGSAEYRALVVRDERDNSAAVQIETAQMKGDKILTIELTGGGDSSRGLRKSE